MLSSAVFDNIDRSASEDSTRVWAEEEKHANKEHICDVTAMDIYDIKMGRREFDHPALVFLDDWLQFLLEQIYSTS